MKWPTYKKSSVLHPLVSVALVVAIVGFILAWPFMLLWNYYVVGYVEYAQTCTFGAAYQVMAIFTAIVVAITGLPELELRVEIED